MKFSAFFVVATGIQSGLGAVLKPRDDPPDGNVQVLEPKNFKDLGSKRVKIRYGPMVVPGIDDESTHGMQSFDGMNAAMPCQDCLIMAALSNLEFEDGTTANANTSMSLHHTVLFNLNRTDATCETFPERFMAAGNERTPLDLTLGGTRKAGYYVKGDDQVFMMTELMNEAQEAQTVYLTAEWEFIEGVPEGFDLAVPLWLDVTGTCSSSEVAIDPEDKIFNFTMSPEWSPKFTGDLFTMVGHLHDGGLKQEVYMDGKKICESVAHYGESEGFMEPMGPMDPMASMERISSITGCDNFGSIGPDNKFSITAFYDLTQHPGMKDHQGGLQPVMGIELLHVGRPKDEAMKDILSSKQPDLQDILGSLP
ncbi:hypothetical protein QBC33DRAFT_496991 [Phialemonium atrogriseum]|uniref:Peptidase A1 domain-containing protein n=1 Tax=Phialemonium atrogriseum TaxID=1093897 RepID=A0AAJ0BUM7_9PEZI|nr:uncharacterized protein QBC33DRAFT_496991 [Phialemonium atrogriseum]KAK1764551.1 hypothetical protein QBC33DRAFT_496991 [Phialemonium atrogriseum]